MQKGRHLDIFEWPRENISFFVKNVDM